MGLSQTRNTTALTRRAGELSPDTVLTQSHRTRVCVSVTSFPDFLSFVIPSKLNVPALEYLVRERLITSLSQLQTELTKPLTSQ